MKLDKFLDVDILTGVVFGVLIGAYGLYTPSETHKAILSILGVVMALKVVGVVK